MKHDFLLRLKASKLRKKGYSFEEISSLVGISKSTSYFWTNNIVLNEIAKRRLVKRSEQGREKALKTKYIRKVLVKKYLSEKIEDDISKIELSSELRRLLSSIFIWTEGGELTGNCVSFMNSNPLMIGTFLYLFRTSFDLDEKKFRALVHIHEYHIDSEIKYYWSEITKIPLTQFTKSYLKPHTKKIKREGYKGCIRINYYNAKIALELRMFYNIFAKKLIGA